MTSFLSLTAVRAVLALLSAGAAILWAAIPAAAHDDRGGEARWKKKRAEYVAGVSVPLLSSPNVRLVGTFPETQAISGVFAKSAPYFYVSSLDSVSVFDVSDPLHPRLTGMLPNLVFENEAVNYGEQVVGGVVNRFVLVGVDLHQASTSDISHINPGAGNEVMVIDVTNPANPRIRSRTAASTSTHTVSCIQETACRYAYTAGSGGKFSVIDLNDLDAPKEIDYDSAADGVQGLPSPAIGWAGHKWNFDAAGYGIHTGAGGAAIFDVANPVEARLITTTDQNGTAAGWNDFIHHNSDRPNATKFTPGAVPNIKNGNVLLVTEEDYENTDCATAGSLQTWYVEKLDGTPAAIHPLDRINPVSALEGLSLPAMTFCSAHWFDYHPSGIVAQGYYEGGLRLIDVRDPKKLKEYGYFASGLSEVWDAYWVPERNSNGVATGRKTNIVYTADLIRGVDVFTVDLPPANDPAPPLLPLAADSPLPGHGTPWKVAAIVAMLLAASVVLRRRLKEPHPARR